MMLPYSPGPVPLDLEEARVWHYPTSDQHHLRDYQLEITQACLAHNTIVSVPTGMGKTHIGAALLLNFRRWFPSGLAVFCAPSLSLVEQQAESCGKVWGDRMRPQEVAVMTGRTPARQRSEWWGSSGTDGTASSSAKRIFFCTPQTVQNDLQTGLMDGRRVVLLVLDEAHRARGDHSYVVIAKHLREQSKAKFRVVGLSATPGGTIEKKAGAPFCRSIVLDRLPSSHRCNESNAS
jgi:ERCC4-related helicase